MVLSMELERSGAVEIVDNKDSSQTLSAVSQRSIDIKIIPTIVTETKKDLKLKLSQRLEKGSVEEDEKTSRSERSDIKSPKSPRTPMSPKSPLSNSSRSFDRSCTITHPTSKTSQIDVVDDRKAPYSL